MDRTSLTLVKEYAALQAKADPIAKRMKEIEASLMKLLPNGKTESAIGDVTVSDNVSYPFAKSNLTPGQVKRILKAPAVDPKKWAAMYADDYASTRTVATQPLKVSVSIHKIKG